MDPEQETVFSSNNEKKHILPLVSVFVILVLGIVFYWLVSFGVEKVAVDNSAEPVVNSPVEVDTSDEVRTAEASEAGSCMLKKCTLDSGGVITMIDNSTVTYLEQYSNNEPVISDKEILLDLSEVVEIDFFDKLEMKYIENTNVEVGDFVQVIKKGNVVELVTVIKN